MLSKLDIPYELEEDTICTVLEKKSNPKIGDQMKVHIPRVMQNIPQTIPPKVMISPYQYNGCFVNSMQCQPKRSSNLFKEQNYLEGEFSNNSTTNPILDVERKEDKELVKTYVEKNKKIRCNFKNGKLNQLKVNTDDNNTDTSKLHTVG